MTEPTLTEQIRYLERCIVEHREAARVAADIPLIRDGHLVDAAMLGAIAETLRAERQRRADHAADWS